MGLFDWIGRSVDELINLGYPESVAKRISSGELPMDEASRMARAAEQGFRKPVMYHGSGSDILEIDPARLQSRDAGVIGEGFYSTQAPFIANQYARLSERLGDNPSVIPLMSRRGDYAQYNLADKGDLAVELAKDRDFSNRLSQSLKDQGYIGAEVRDASGGIVERVNFDPNDVRSLLSAAFDPEYTGPNILGSRIAPTAGAGLFGAMALQSNDTEAGMNMKFSKPSIPDAKLDHFALGAETAKNAYDELLDVVGYGADADEMLDAAQQLSPRTKNLINAIARDDFLGFDDPSQALRQIIKEPEETLMNYELSPQLKGALTKFANNPPSKPVKTLDDVNWPLRSAPPVAAGLLGLTGADQSEAGSLIDSLPMAAQAAGQSAMDAKPDLGRDTGTILGLMDLLLPLVGEAFKPATMGNAELTDEQRRMRKYYGQ